jgi:quercetin dioxygenase-like cupin family protein
MSTASGQQSRLIILLGVVTLVALTVLVTGGMQPAASQDPPAPIVPEQLTRVTFPDDVDAKFKVTLHTDREHPTDQGRQKGARTHVAQTRDASEVVMVKITVQPGARFPWHTHSGPVIVAVHEGQLTYVEAHDCSERTYRAEQAFVDPGGGHVHTAYNPGPGVTVLYATFLGVEGMPTIPVDMPADHCT